MIEKLDIDLFPESAKQVYEKEKAKYIAEYQEPGFFGWRSRPDVAEAKWRNVYPRGYGDWAQNYYRLNSTGEQNVINKINELVEVVNEGKKCEK